MESDEYGIGKRTLRLTLWIPPSKITIKDEYYTTDGSGVMGNIGGMIGMLLGASALSLLNMVLEFMFTRSQKAMKHTCTCI